MEEKQNILIYQNPDGNIKLDVHLQNESVWVTQEQMALLFGKAKSTISEHTKNIYLENELEKSSTVRNFRTVRFKGNLEIERDLEHYNLILGICE